VTDAALIVAAVAVVVALVAMIQVVTLRRKLDAVPTDGDIVGLITQSVASTKANASSVADLNARLKDVETRIPYAISYVGVVSYDAFGNIAGHQSRSVALLNQRADGLVISILVSRDDVVFFTKQVAAGHGLEALSPEEVAAVDRALGR
jgi:Protein of unknown function (DUF4446)